MNSIFLSNINYLTDELLTKISNQNINVIISPSNLENKIDTTILSKILQVNESDLITLNDGSFTTLNYSDINDRFFRNIFKENIEHKHIKIYCIP